MTRGFVFLLLAVAALFYGWSRAITQDGLVHYLDENPTTWRADAVLFTLGGYHELFNNNQKAIDIYRRVVKVYPDSPKADLAQFGVAAGYERLHDRRMAIAEYETYIRMFPKGHYAKTVQRSLDLLK